VTPDYLSEIPANWQATLATGNNKSSKDGEWVNKDFDLNRLVAVLTKHNIGPKDGPCFLQGKATGGTRLTKAMSALHIIGIDVDNGMPSSEIDEIVQERGLFCIRYTTHSHGKNYTEINSDAYAKYARKNNNATIAEYLVAEKRYLPEIAQQAHNVTKEMTKAGVILRVEHPAMDKNRLIFVLAKPWQVQEYELQEEAIKDWKDAYTNFASWLGIEVDKSCTDPARLFYLPRYESGALYEATVHKGKAVNIFGLPKTRLSGVTSGNVFLDAAAAMGIKDAVPGHSLKRWAAKNADRFQIVDALEEHAPHVFRNEQDKDGKRHIECPFEDNHTTPGGTATFIVNAGEGTGSGFTIKCMHAGCIERDRLGFLAEMIEKEWLPEDALTDDDFLLEIEDDEEEPQTEQEIAEAVAEAEAELDADEDYAEAVAEAEAVIAESRVVGDMPEVSKVVDLKTADQYIRSLAEAGLTLIEAAEGFDTLRSHLLFTLRIDLPKTDITRAFTSYATQRQRRLREAEREAERRKTEAAKEILRKRKLKQQEKEAQEKKDYRKELVEKEVTSSPLPVILVDDTNHLTSVDIALSALVQKNNAKPYIFRNAGALARIIHDEQKMPRAERMQLEEMRYELTHVARYLETKPDGFKEVPATNNVVKHILADPALPFPVLGGIVTAPVFGADGKINTKPGYDHSSQLYYEPPANFAVPKISEKPTEDEVDEALDLLMRNVLVDFPFDGPDDGAAERAHALCMLLQPFTRQLISGATPIYLIVKPTPGTGASKLVNIFSLISTGEEAVAQTETRSEDEIRKRITSVLLEASPTFYLDNINYRIDSSALASAVTTSWWTDRILGSTKTVRVPVKHTWIFAGNNPTMSNEIARRCVRIRLDAKVERPELRTNFKHKDLEGWVRTNRSKLIWACLTLIQNWIAQGKPDSKANKGSFEPWSRTMGGILEAARIDGFLQNDSELRDAADEEGSAIKMMLEIWWENFRDKPTTVGGNGANLYDMVQDEDIPLPIVGNNESNLKISFGKYIKRLQGRIFTIYDDGGNPLQVSINDGGKKSNKQIWQLAKVETPPQTK